MSVKKYIAIKRLVLTITVACGVIAGSFGVSAYRIWYSYGYSPVPANVRYSAEFSAETIDCIVGASNQWSNYNTSKGRGRLINIVGSHTTPYFNYQNNGSEITKGYRGSREYLAQTYVASCDYPGGTIYEADIDYNVSHTYGSGSGAYDQWSVTAHEFGHLLGLDDITSSSSSASTTIMYQNFVPGDWTRRTLKQDDRNGIDAIYGR